MCGELWSKSIKGKILSRSSGMGVDRCWYKWQRLNGRDMQVLFSVQHDMLRQGLYDPVELEPSLRQAIGWEVDYGSKPSISH